MTDNLITVPCAECGEPVEITQPHHSDCQAFQIEPPELAEWVEEERLGDRDDTYVEVILSVFAGQPTYTPPLLIGVADGVEIESVIEWIQEEFDTHEQSRYQAIGEITVVGPIIIGTELERLASDRRIQGVECAGKGIQLLDE